MEGRRFDDVVARGFFPVDIHDPTGAKGYQAGGSTWIKPKGPYDIPLRCLIPQKVDGVLMTGRNISAAHEAHGSLRVQGPAFAHRRMRRRGGGHRRARQDAAAQRRCPQGAEAANSRQCEPGDRPVGADAQRCVNGVRLNSVQSRSRRRGALPGGGRLSAGQGYPLSTH